MQSALNFQLPTPSVFRPKVVRKRKSPER
jgi:hypothetical protein